MRRRSLSGVKQLEQMMNGAPFRTGRQWCRDAGGGPTVVVVATVMVARRSLRVVVIVARRVGSAPAIEVVLLTLTSGETALCSASSSSF
jgi:hypothetical protein